MHDKDTDYTDDELRKKERARNQAAMRTALTGRTHIPNTATESDREKALAKVRNGRKGETDE